jgi:hypothetical protein
VKLIAAVKANPERRVGRREQPRVTCQIGVEVRDGTSSWQRALLCDVSVTGFLLTLPAGELRKENLWLRMPGMEPLAATVRWRKGTLCGCQFFYPLDRPAQARVEQLLEAHHSKGPRSASFAA